MRAADGDCVSLLDDGNRVVSQESFLAGLVPAGNLSPDIHRNFRGLIGGDFDGAEADIHNQRAACGGVEVGFDLFFRRSECRARSQ